MLAEKQFGLKHSFLLPVIDSDLSKNKFSTSYQTLTKRQYVLLTKKWREVLVMNLLLWMTHAESAGLFCPFLIGNQLLFHQAHIWCVYHIRPGGWGRSHRTACSFCFGLRAEGFRPIKQTELLMCQCGSQTLVHFPTGNHGTDDEDHWGLQQAFQPCEQCEKGGEMYTDRQTDSSLGLKSAYGCWVLL